MQANAMRGHANGSVATKPDFNRHVLVLISAMLVSSMLAGCVHRYDRPVRVAPQAVPEAASAEPVPQVFPVLEAGQLPGLGRVALVVRAEVYDLRIVRLARDRNMLASTYRTGSGIGNCGGDLATCLAVALVVGVVVDYGVINSTSRKADAVTVRASAASSVVKGSMIQGAMRDALLVAARAQGIKLTESRPFTMAEGEDAPDYRALAARGIDTVLEIKLDQVFNEPPINMERPDLDPYLTLEMGTHVRMVKTRDNAEMRVDDYTYRGKQYRYSRWADDGAKLLAGAMQKGYEVLGRDISEGIFRLYPFAGRTEESGYCGLKAITPNADLAESLSPVFSWERFPRDSDRAAAREDMGRVKNVRYELMVGSGGNGETPDEIYRVDGLKDTAHQLPLRLSRNTRYFWSVRAHFNLDGRERVTEWSTYCPYAQQLVVGSSIYRFYTPKNVSAESEKLSEAFAEAPGPDGIPEVHMATRKKLVKGPGALW